LETLTPTQYQALTLLAAGYSNQEAAVATGVAIRTIERWKKKPDFQKLLREAVTKSFDAAIAELVSGSREAAKELKQIISSPDTGDRIKVTAISVLFANAIKVRDWSLEERLERIENLLNGTHENQTPTD